MGTDPIWLDHAATSWPKPPAVLAAITRWFEELGVDGSRGSTRRHQEVRKLIAACRAKLGELCKATPENVIFCSGATEAINLFLKGSLSDGARVWTTSLEHNAVARTLEALRRERSLHIEVFEPRSAGEAVDEIDLLDRLQREAPPQLLVYNHVSNVTGARTELGRAAAWIREAGGVTLVDCAQSAGRLPLDEVDADALAFPAHKGLQGPPGLGVLVLRRGLDCQPLRHGGTGSSAPSLDMPDDAPTRFEAGTPNTPAILGLLEGLRWVEERGIDVIHAHEVASTARLCQALDEACASGRAQRHGGKDSGVVAFSFADLDPHEAALALADDEIYVRAGFHCTTRLHEGLGARTGTLRFSPGPTTRAEDIDRAAAALLACL